MRTLGNNSCGDFKEGGIVSECMALFFQASYIILFCICFLFSRLVDIDSLNTAIFVGAVQLAYSFVYLFPAFVVTYSIAWLGKLLKYNKFKFMKYLIFTVAVTSTAATMIFLVIDSRVYKLFGFHLNGFVWNLISTSGGIESMGSDSASYLTAALLIMICFVLQTSLLVVCIRRGQTSTKNKIEKLRRRKIIRFFLVFLFLDATYACIVWGFAQIQGSSPVLVASTKFPLYQPITFRSLAKKLGYNIHKREQLKLSSKATSLNYPLHPLVVEPPQKPMNIVWLAVESWRADALNPEIMPATYKFAKNAHHFINHYSGGNGTRMGIFTMFYGLYGSYWFDFLNEGMSPVIMDVLEQTGYQFEMFTSAKFTYPEFDKTVFINIPRSKLHQSGGCGGFVNDRNNVASLIDFIKHRDTNRPFMTFMFFESPHAPYTFPEECVVRKDYLEHINYNTTNIAAEIDRIQNRYLNACNHLDTQLKRIFDFLGQSGLLKSTLVIVTGDHGEEFMEKGRWGHNSEFHQEQLCVPFILWVPDDGKGEHSFMSSHLDIPATIAPFLGVKNPPEDYSVGYDLLGEKHRKFTVCSSWNMIGYVDDEYKLTTSLHYSLLLPDRLTTKNDNPVLERPFFYMSRKEPLLSFMKSMGQFYNKN